MAETETLADRFEAHRAHLHAVAYRMLGGIGEADDAVQEAWLRLSRADAGAVDNLGGWLTTVVARICLDQLRARKSRREESLAGEAVAPASAPPDGLGPEAELQLADSMGVALLVVLETLAPAERIAFVLHDMFDVPFEEIAPIVGRNAAATRQLASRARRRVQGASPGADAPDPARQRQVVDAFLAASRGGDLQALLAALDPDVVLRADPIAVATAARAGQGAPALAPEVRGAHAVAGSLAGRARGGVGARGRGAGGLLLHAGERQDRRHRHHHGRSPPARARSGGVRCASAMSGPQQSSQSSQPSIDKCVTCLGSGEIGTENGPVSCPDCFGEGRRLALAERVEWRMRDIERSHRTDSHGCARDMNWLVFELRRSRDALQRILARCQDEDAEDAGNALAKEVKFVANEVLELYEMRR